MKRWNNYLLLLCAILLLAICFISIAGSMRGHNNTDDNGNDTTAIYYPRH